MNRLSKERQAQIVAALVEGNSIRATCRMTGTAKGTVLKLLRDLGLACMGFHDTHMRGVRARRVQCDEIWSFCYAKSKTVLSKAHLANAPGVGNVWTWVGLDADSKLAISYLVGGRSAQWANAFMADLAYRVESRVQITTDGHGVYLDAVEGAFGWDVDYAMLVKLYGEESKSETRYSPGECVGCKRTKITGRPALRHISTSFVERQNLTMRMSMRRFTRLSNGFSKKVENLRYAVGLHFMYYNYARIHQTLRVTPAMEAGLADHAWDLQEIVGLLAPK